MRLTNGNNSTQMNRRNIAIIMMLSASLLLMAGGKRVLFIGDSITDGAWGNSKVWNTPSAQRNHNDMNHIYGHGYMMIAASHYEALFFIESGLANLRKSVPEMVFDFSVHCVVNYLSV